MGEKENPMSESGKFVIGIVATLLATGLVMVYSIESAQCGVIEQVNQELLKQLTLLVLGAMAMLIASRVDYHKLLQLKAVFLVLMWALLIMVLIPGVGATINYSQRWFRMGSLSFQPSEFAKFALLIFITGYLTQYKDRLTSFWRGFFPLVIIIGGTLGLIMKEPDIGTAGLIGLSAVAMLFVGGIRYRHLLPFAGMGAIGVVYLLVSSSRFNYIMERTKVFWDPESDALGKGHQIIQSMLALGSGGVFGVGLGGSLQKRFFLPEAKSDFIFAIIGEELGLIGALVVVLLYVGFLWYGLKIARAARDSAGFMLAFGITMIISVQALINLAVVTKCMPPKGIPLPFVSEGGTSIVLMMAGVGILLNIARQGANEYPAVERAVVKPAVPVEQV